MDEKLLRRHEIGNGILWFMAGGLLCALLLLSLFYSRSGIQLDPKDFISLIIAALAIILSAIVGTDTYYIARKNDDQFNEISRKIDTISERLENL